MPDVSEWNERERDAATEALIAYVHNWRLQGRTAQIDREAPSCVDAMLSAVDAVRREPTEPVNTIKFDPKTGDVARCMSHNGVRFWAPLILMPPPAPGQVARVNTEGWVTIHHPEKIALIFRQGHIS
ncbi:Uncharacterised protein [Mycobacteroides abscessus subsp. massiliense]|uniref:hypothetical protein n=1 Tax=Mycobacteroides abscessus TaxID=36809 RepID=UPI0009A79A26|nr:hypothetical protein [Mycobacteroides abscessus]SKU71718.1 Uncharacterised protein [Mycobacteroides abscessus subsp. massiliense]SKV04097.1 Uncharacterised protein [Mycobacteroides abscessus subsp. massiliense]